VVVYEWLCGSVPFSEGDFIQLGYQHSHEPVPPLRQKNTDIPAEVEAVIMKALAKEPKDRFASVRTFEQAHKVKEEQRRRLEEAATKKASAIWSPPILMPSGVNRCSLGHTNPAGSFFCDECGEPLAHTAPPSAATAVDQPCPECGVMNPISEPFCWNCGAPLLTYRSGAVVPSSAPAGTGMKARLIVEADKQEFDISGKDNILIGREDVVRNIFPDIDLTPDGGEVGGVSFLHARVFVENGQYMLEDENSTNFTFLNRKRVAAKTPTPLHDNDVIRLGRVDLRFRTP
jgi:hypothetical protein